MPNDGVLDPDKHYFSTSTTLYTSSILPRIDLKIYSSSILTCTQIRNNVSNLLIPRPYINVITVQPNFWRKKSVNKYDPIPYDDIDEDLHGFKSFRKSMKRLTNFVPRPYFDLILLDKAID